MQYGHYDDYVIMSAYQPVMSLSDGCLTPVAVEGLAAVRRQGQRIPAREMFANIPEKDRLFVESLCATLHFSNFKPAGLEHLNLFFNFDPSAYPKLGPAIHEIRATARIVGELGLDPRLLVCEITEAAAIGDDILLELVREIRRQGVHIAIDNFGKGQSGWERFDLIEPDIVKIDANWFQRIATQEKALQLLSRLIEQFDERDIPVMIEGIETPVHLKAGIDAGARHFQGFLFGRPALAGTDLEEKPITLSSLLKSAPVHRHPRFAGQA